ncbi:low temperature requirement protein A [Solirubrobacter ginsenosidimutans]|uniref:Low temperature requirement protein A n=1 Tax=Solirubrobacter ginsenosidimutans TaxID=490573 RepID=A0A9X3RYE1_9ACTN|nr:low temperature requirement protein A [Solirubrobacter ginsenosidimutans]MDA0159540.1 low temperature requirement protein A [Solirubrobacter ginsenosidimutans]
MSQQVAHRRRRFSGRDPEEDHRASTPLELLYDLTIVVAFGTAADELAHFIAEGHAWAGIGGFVFACFAVIWAWVNYSWFASAYDTDDWLFRLATFVQMVGVIVLSLGLPQMFESIDHGDTLDNGVMVAGYVVMRVALVFLWWQVSRNDPVRAPAARSYMTTIGIAQAGWVALVFLDLPIATTFVAMSALLALEVVGPFLAERKAQTPWHAEHIAERYGLLVIITLGEVIIGTVAALNALVHGEAGWTLDAALLAVAGVGLAFGCWWVYFALPWGEPLARLRQRMFVFGYGHFLIFAPLAAMGAGLHVAAFALEGEVEISETAIVLSVTIPVGIFILAIYGLYSVLLREHDALHLGLLAGSAALLVLTVALAAVGVSVAICLLVLTLVPAVTILGYETVGHRHVARALQRL